VTSATHVLEEAERNQGSDRFAKGSIRRHDGRALCVVLGQNTATRSWPERRPSLRFSNVSAFSRWLSRSCNQGIDLPIRSRSELSLRIARVPSGPDTRPELWNRDATKSAGRRYDTALTSAMGVERFCCNDIGLRCAGAVGRLAAHAALSNKSAMTTAWPRKVLQAAVDVVDVETGDLHRFRWDRAQLLWGKEASRAGWDAAPTWSGRAHGSLTAPL
jgi:hypothetical protein